MVQVLGYSELTHQDCLRSWETLKKDPANRKATKQMALAVQAIDLLMVSLSERTRSFLRSTETHLILGSSQGELEPTKDFLTTWSAQKMARPLLFQNSLHHSTVGFLTCRFGLKGSGIAVSQSQYSSQNAIETAELILDGGTLRASPELALVMRIDVQVTGLESPKVNEGCAVLLLANSYAMGLLEEKSLGTLDSYHHVFHQGSHPQN